MAKKGNKKSCTAKKSDNVQRIFENSAVDVENVDGSNPIIEYGIAVTEDIPAAKSIPSTKESDAKSHSVCDSEPNHPKIS
jgi:hypothetical protein